MITTTAPKFTTEVVTKAIDTEVKTTQGKTFFEYYAAKDFVVHLQYNQAREYKVGDKVKVHNAAGQTTYEDVYFFGHQVANSSNRYYRIRLAAAAARPPTPAAPSPPPSSPVPSCRH